MMLHRSLLFTTIKEAERWLKALYGNTGEERLSRIYGSQSKDTFRVDPIECWDNGDTKGIYVD